MGRKEGEPRRGQAALVFSEGRACFVFCGLPPHPHPFPPIPSVLSGFVQGLGKSKNKDISTIPDKENCDAGDLKWFNLSIYLQSNKSAHTLDVFIIFVKKKYHVW